MYVNFSWRLIKCKWLIWFEGASMHHSFRSLHCSDLPCYISAVWTWHVWVTVPRFSVAFFCFHYVAWALQWPWPSPPPVTWTLCLRSRVNKWLLFIQCQTENIITPLWELGIHLNNAVLQLHYYLFHSLLAGKVGLLLSQTIHSMNISFTGLGLA